MAAARRLCGLREAERMLHDYRYSPTWDKSDVVLHLQRSRFGRVLDIGGSMGGWSTDYITHDVDIE
ncbi:MAG: hypothetical protein ABL997_03365 [Planctomycetota bacterium]